MSPSFSNNRFRWLGLAALFIGAAMFYLGILIPLEAARRHETGIELPDQPDAFVWSLCVVVGAALALFGRKPWDWIFRKDAKGQTVVPKRAAAVLLALFVIGFATAGYIGIQFSDLGYSLPSGSEH